MFFSIPAARVTRYTPLLGAVLVSLCSVAVGQPKLFDPAGFKLEKFAEVPSPFHLAFDGDGNLFVGNAGIGLPADTPLNIHRVNPGGTVEEFGDAVVDPDGLVVDISGTLSAPGSVIVTIGDGSTSGFVVITPDGSSTAELVKGPFEEALSNPQQLAFDSAGRFLYGNCGGGPKGTPRGSVGTLTNLTPTVVHDLVDDCLGGIAIGFEDRIFVSLNGFGEIREVIENGQTSDELVACNLSAPDGLAFAPENFGGVDVPLFVAERGTGEITRVNPDNGEVRLFATDLENPFGLAFGPDRCLYVAENGTETVWRICETQRLVFPAIVRGAGSFSKLVVSTGNEEASVTATFVRSDGEELASEELVLGENGTGELLFEGAANLEVGYLDVVIEPARSRPVVSEIIQLELGGERPAPIGVGSAALCSKPGFSLIRNAESNTGGAFASILEEPITCDWSIFTGLTGILAAEGNFQIPAGGQYQFFPAEGTSLPADFVGNFQAFCTAPVYGFSLFQQSKDGSLTSNSAGV